MYDLESVKIPRLSGFPLKLITGILESPLRGLLVPGLLKSSGLTWLREQDFDESPTFYPIHHQGILNDKSSSVPVEDRPVQAAGKSGSPFVTLNDYCAQYDSRRSSPVQVANRVQLAIFDSDKNDPPLRAFIITDPEDVNRQAVNSDERIRQNNKLSNLDGVPIAIKDEVNILSYPTTDGRSFQAVRNAAADATVVDRLRSSGALIIGKTNMHEIGIGVTGLNPHYGVVRNPYNLAHHSGGSSSGSAAAVAAGICPAAIGADGGGSIRIPAAFCGLVGLKSTFGRISEHGATPLDWSVAHLGPITASVQDAVTIWSVIAGPDTRDPVSLHQPLPTIKGWDNTDLSDLTVGVYPEWFQHADQEVVAVCEKMLDNLVKQGAALREIIIPDLNAGRIAHLVTIASEMAQAEERYKSEHKRDYGLDVRINLALAREFTSRDYIKAQRVRTRMINHFNRAFESVDAILTPTTGIPAPPISENALPDGISDLSTLTEIMRFTTYANLTGLPAISFPAGYTQKGLPVGLQAMGRAWDEVTLFRLAKAGEDSLEKHLPSFYINILEEND